MTLPEIVQGPIAAEFGGDLFLLAAAKKPKPGPASCGITCTGPKGSTESCPKSPIKKKRTQDFQPTIEGWSAPPAARTC